MSGKGIRNGPIPLPIIPLPNSGAATVFPAIIPANLSPKDLLYPLQRKFIDDAAQYKIGVTTRQWGKSTVTSGEAVNDCVRDPGTKWVCMSAGERQSVEWLNKAKEWQSAYKAVIVDNTEDRGGVAEGLLRSSEITFQNGSRIIAIPANPSTARLLGEHHSGRVRLSRRSGCHLGRDVPEHNKPPRGNVPHALERIAQGRG